ncbi:ATP-dependent zinc metalloprotease FtsH [bacterium]|nr:ATP-dependent zinc metalloprotease FtsH [bacterium]
MTEETNKKNSANNTQKPIKSNHKGEEKIVRVDIRRMPRRNKISPLTIGIAIFACIAVLFMVNNLLNRNGEKVAVSEVVRTIANNNYDKITLKDNNVVLEKNITEGDGIKLVKRVYCVLPEGTDFYQLLSNEKISVQSLKEDYYEPALGITFGDIISLIFLIAGCVMVYILFRNMQNSGGQIMNFGESKARLLLGKRTGITFDKVAGIDEVKEEVKEIVDFLKNPKKYQDLGARIPRGVLLAGEPGTGKTLLAKAIAGEAGVPFFHTSGSEFEEMLVGAGASRVRDLFKKARRVAPCIIFIDEIDAVAKKRGTVLHSGAGEQTLNQILVEMDGLEERENVIVLAATNRPDTLDPAILRPGRFDRVVTVPMPDAHGRKAILDIHAKNKKFDDDIDLDMLAKKTVGYSGADLENLLNEAAIAVAKDNRKKISYEDLMEAYLKVKLGRKKKTGKDEDDLKKTAYHETGHAVVAQFTPGSDPVEQISIISRGMTGGVTVYVPERERTSLYKKQMLAWLRSGVAGRAAEELFLEDISSGASADIEQATNVAKEMVMKYGMSNKLGLVKYGNEEESSHLGYAYGGDRDYSEKTAEIIDEEVKRLVGEAYEDAKKTLLAHKDIVEKVVAELLEKEVLSGDEFRALCK